MASTTTSTETTGTKTTTTTSATAITEKEKGNNYVKNKDYGSAEQAYLDALSLSPSPDVECQIHANLALVYQKRSEHTMAEDECTKALLMDELNPKLWFRRSQIRESLENIHGALQDMRQCVEIFDTIGGSSGYGTAKKSVARLEKAYSEELLQKKRDAIAKACEERIREKELEAKKREEDRIKREAEEAARIEVERREMEELTKRIRVIQDKHVNTTDVVMNDTTMEITEKLKIIQRKIIGDDSEEESIEEKKLNDEAQKKKKRKKKKKKNQKKHTPRIKFGSVTAREYRRCMMSATGIPNHGGWPLGMSNDIVREAEWGTVDDVEIIRQETLKKRLQKVMGADAAIDENFLLETRQFDYKKREERVNGVNPLFSHIDENERKAILCRDVGFDFNLAPLPPTSSPTNPAQCKKRKPNKKNRRQVYDESAHVLKRNSLPYNSTEILHVQKELEQIRDYRSHPNQGCSCRKIALHHKHKHGKKGKGLTENKLRSELRKRGMTSETHKSRAEMEAILDKVMKDEPCCRDDNCPCVKNGIGCLADVCACWNDGKGNAGLGVEEIKEACGSRLGMEVCSADVISENRKKFLTAKKIKG
mmetsp:Transcript_59104/g.70502  ORF Transcript_59104/g.70502 Transcript_59104/m.70502 type:complete len:594 (+) Transcript_59104:76-1857(+)